MVLKYLDKLGELTSIEVARERIALLAEQLEVKDTECKALGEEVERLKSENDQLTGENSRLNAALEEATNEDVSEPELKDVQVEILRQLFRTGSRGLLVRELATWLQVNESTAQYHIEALEKTGLIEDARLIMGEGIYYGLSKSGRAYLIDLNLAD